MNPYLKVLIVLILLALLVMILRVGELYTQLARYQRYWDRVNQKPPAQDELVYVAFGDSAAQGVGASAPDKGYVGLIAESLATANDKPVRIINLSKSGAKASDVLSTQLPKYRALELPRGQAQILTIEIGANDIISFNSAKFEKDMDKLMSELPKATVMSDIPSFAGSRLARYEDRVAEANRILYDLAAKHGYELAGLHSQVRKNHGLRTFSADFFHPSDYGYKTNWLPVFMDRINKASEAL